jgi:hypothetical protein
MPRTGRRRSLTIAAAIFATLAAPAAAQAASYTVKAGDGPCGGADLACGSLAEAATAAAAGDVFTVTPGAAGTSFGSATFTAPNVTITGAPNFTVDGSLAFTGNGTVASKLQKVALVQANGSNAGVIVTGTAGLEIDDSQIDGGNGDGVTFSEGVTNKIVRSFVFTAGQATAAVRVTSADLSSAPKKLTMDSSIVSGGAAGLSVNTGANGPQSLAGDVDVVLHHVTSAGSTNGLVLNASKAIDLIGGPVGNITAEVTDSIIQNGTAKTVYPGVLGTLTLTAAPNTITDTYTRTLQNFDAGTVFVNPTSRNYRLKAGSPAIDVGGFTEGESATDIEGDPRPGPTTDLGADEYVAPAPGTGTTPPPPAPTTDGTLPAITITSPKQNQKVKLTKVTTKTTTVTKNGKKVKVKKKTSKPAKISFSGKATDASGVKGVVLTVEKLSSTPSKPKTSAKASAATPAPAATATKCKWLNASKGIVTKSCTKPIVLLASLAKDGTWKFNVKSTVKLGAGVYRIIVAGADNSGAFGNSAPAADAIHRFTLVK